MKGKFKPFSTTLIGSLPRSKELLSLKESSDNYDKFKSLYNEKLLEETKKVVELQKECGIDVLVSGELNRDNYMSYVAEMVDGIKLLSMNDLKDRYHTTQTNRKGGRHGISSYFRTPERVH